MHWIDALTDEINAHTEKERIMMTFLLTDIYNDGTHHFDHEPGKVSSYCINCLRDHIKHLETERNELWNRHVL